MQAIATTGVAPHACNIAHEMIDVAQPNVKKFMKLFLFFKFCAKIE